MTDDTNPTDYLKDLERWQAYSHPELVTSKPEELFEPECTERYHRLHNNLWGRMIRMHGTIHTVGQLKQFPFDYLYSRNRVEFWRLAVDDFVDIACMMIHSLVSDAGTDVHSIPYIQELHRQMAMAVPTETRFVQGNVEGTEIQWGRQVYCRAGEEYSRQSYRASIDRQAKRDPEGTTLCR